MGAPGFLAVSEHVARNPIARAVARARMHAAVRDFAIEVYLLDDGDDVRFELSAAARVLAVACRVADRRAGTDPALREAPELRVMAGGMGAIAQCAGRGWRWRTLDAVAIDRALQEALALLASAAPHETREAWIYVETMQPAAAHHAPPAGEHAA